jgi:hypothetical protein
VNPPRWGLFLIFGVVLGAVLSPLASILARVLHHNMGEWADIDDEADT